MKDDEVVKRSVWTFCVDFATPEITTKIISLNY